MAGKAPGKNGISLDSYTGALYQYSNGESKKIDDDVSALIIVEDDVIGKPIYEDCLSWGVKV